MTAVAAHHYHQSARPSQQQLPSPHHALTTSSSSGRPESSSPRRPAEDSIEVTAIHLPKPSNSPSIQNNSYPIVTGATMPSRLGTNGVSAERSSPRSTQSRGERETKPTNGRPNGAVDSSDSDRRAADRSSNQKKLTIVTSHDDGDHSRTQRPKPPLLRSKSDYLVRREAQEQEPIEDESYDWGARHGFEDHYQSEDIISQLANVSDFQPVSMQHLDARS
jgi:regulatory associated protein of mTOR